MGIKNMAAESTGEQAPRQQPKEQNVKHESLLEDFFFISSLFICKN
jgi:hypothetical protein